MREFENALLINEERSGRFVCPVLVGELNEETNAFIAFNGFRGDLYDEHLEGGAFQSVTF